MLVSSFSVPLVSGAEIDESATSEESIVESSVEESSEIINPEASSEEISSEEADIPNEEDIEAPVEETESETGEDSTEESEIVETDESTESEVTELVEDVEVIEEVEEIEDVEIIEEEQQPSKASRASISTFSRSSVESAVSNDRTVGYNVSYKSDTNLYNKPSDFSGSSVIGKLSAYSKTNLIAKKEYGSGNQTWVLISQNGKEIGWVLKQAITAIFGSIYATNDVAYHASITSSYYNVYSEPAWVSNGYLVANASTYLNQSIIVWKEMFTSEGTFVYISINGEEIGWINKNGIRTNFNSINQTNIVSYRAKISQETYNIYKTPAWSTNGKFVDFASRYLNQTIHITQEKVTSDGTFVLVRINGKELGWMNKKGISPQYGKIIKTNNVAYDATISSDYYNIYTNTPWVSDGYLKHDTTAMLGKKVQVMRERFTSEGTFVQVFDNGTNLGWVNKNGITPNYVPIQATNHVSYMVEVVNAYYNVYKIPAWSTNGHLSVYTSDILGEKFEVTQEKVTPKGTYVLVTIDGVQLGWLDKRATKNTVPTVFLDPGHGGSDSGASYYGVNEKTINMQVSNKIKSLLEARGYKVIMSRTSDVFIDHSTDRSKLANSSDADIFVSVHHNAMPNNSYVNGIETFYYQYDPDYPSKINQQFHNSPDRLKKSAELANAIHSALIKSTGAFDRGVRRETFAVLRETAIPAVLLELGFMSNKTELNKLTTNSYQNKLAKAVVDGIDSYFK